MPPASTQQDLEKVVGAPSLEHRGQRLILKHFLCMFLSMLVGDTDLF